VATKKSSSERVEFAVKLPGRDEKNGEVVWLPIDSKFPQEDYQRLMDAQEQGNPALAEESAKALEIRIKGCAKDIMDKYIDPPGTTDFGIMFLPTEGLYAEVLRRPGLCDCLQREYRIVIAGPTNLIALLNSLQMGFRTLAIEKRSSEVWTLLGAVKTEFGRFGDILDKTQKKLQEASNTIEDAARKSRSIGRKLKNVQELSLDDSAALLEDADDTGSSQIAASIEESQE
jgi:DNA recombination protein RmuC